MADTSVKFFHSEMAGAPVMNGLAGSLINVLNACLINGFGLKNVDSCVITGGVAKLNISTGHSAVVGSIVQVANAVPAALNGEQRVTAITPVSVSFATSLSDQTATGAITVKQAPAGWVSPFVGTNIATYKSPDLAATGCVLRVDDTATRYSRVVGYEAMTDINTGTGPFPTTAQRTGGSYWSKSSSADSVARSWILVGDSRSFIFIRTYYAGAVTNEVTTFGDISTLKTPDPYACVLTGMQSDVSSSPYNTYSLHSSDYNKSEVYMPRSYTGIGSAIQLSKVSPAMFTSSNAWNSGYNTAANSPTYPNPVDGGVYFSTLYFLENLGTALRGICPGYYYILNYIPTSTFSNKDTITGVVGMSGKTMMLHYGQGSGGYGAVDITGPWR